MLFINALAFFPTPALQPSTAKRAKSSIKNTLSQDLACRYRMWKLWLRLKVQAGSVSCHDFIEILEKLFYLFCSSCSLCFGWQTPGVSTMRCFVRHVIITQQMQQPIIHPKTLSSPVTNSVFPAMMPLWMFRDLIRRMSSTEGRNWPGAPLQQLCFPIMQDTMFRP